MTKERPTTIALLTVLLEVLDACDIQRSLQGGHQPRGDE
jgi:hypothetical protein